MGCHEIGHIDFCNQISGNTGCCTGIEGGPGDQEAADRDDNACFGAEMALLYQVAGCEDTNAPGFDGTSYINRWPDGTANAPTPILFSSLKTGAGFSAAVSQLAFEADLPRIEAASLGGRCNRSSGAGCTNPPLTDDPGPTPGTFLAATFYPCFSQVGTTASCRWGIGSTLAGTTNNFGGSSQEFGPLLQVDLLGVWRQRRDAAALQ